jgi:hypothetical protein
LIAEQDSYQAIRDANCALQQNDRCQGETSTMHSNGAYWGKTVFWGAVAGALYAAIFYYADLILYLAHTTPDACVVGQGVDATYFHTVDAAACAAKGGAVVPGTWWHVLVPIAIAFGISFVHGAFTGLFWEMMGLKPATRSK